MPSLRFAVAVALVIFTLAPRVVAASTPLQAALDLYASAAYEEALAALDEVNGADLSADDHVVLAQHRMLCLMAIGRTAAAEGAAADLLALRPDFTLAARDASPRVRTMFDATRRRVLPGVVRDVFSLARKLYDAGELTQARTAFASLTQALSDDALLASDPALADLRTLADGFLALASGTAPRAESTSPSPAVSPAAPIATEAERRPDASLDTSTPAVVPAPETPVPTPSPDPAPNPAVVGEDESLVSFPSDRSVNWRSGEGAILPDPHPAAAAHMVSAGSETAPERAVVAEPVAAPEPPALVAAAPASPLASAAAVAPASTVAPGAPFTPIEIYTYDWRSKDVTPPVAIAQEVSGWWGSMGEPPAGTPLGAVDLLIDEHGRVTEARVHLSVNRVYDAVLLESIKHWRYTPASRGGRAVKYRRITSVVSGR